MLTLTIQNPAELFDRIQAATERAVSAAADEIAAELKAKIAAPKSGRVYRRNGGLHRASAPGEPPANDTGALAGSIAVIQSASLETAVGTSVNYAQFLESGTSRLAPRPLWERTLTEKLPSLETMLQAEFSRL